jgi:hypothetical protein
MDYGNNLKPKKTMNPNIYSVTDEMLNYDPSKFTNEQNAQWITSNIRIPGTRKDFIKPNLYKANKETVLQYINDFKKMFSKFGAGEYTPDAILEILNSLIG